MLTAADLESAGWAACGQTALAAVLERRLDEVRQACPDHRWMSAKDMRTALYKLGIRVHSTPVSRNEDGFVAAAWPTYGLALLQLRGPWERPCVPKVASLEQTHWIGVTPLEGGRHIDQTMIFDVNALAQGLNHGWLPRAIWETHILSHVIRRTRRSTGGWWLRTGFDVNR